MLDRTRLRRLGTFCYVWLMLGFFSGTLLLVGPVRWITSTLRSGGYRQATEDAVMLGVIVLFVVLSAACAWLAARWMSRCPSRPRRLALPIVLTIAAGAALYAWTNPAVMASAAGGISGSVETGNAEFVFGPYPDRRKLESLKREGYTAVVSLQHPAVLPFEPPGIAEETRAAAEIGLTFIHAPMLPWISDNEASLDRIRRLARDGEGRYYVHCGLGRDRANVVKRMLEREGAAVAAGEGFRAPGTFATRLAEGHAAMERGHLHRLDDGVWLIPYPNRHELFGNMLSGQVGHVVLLLEANRGDERAWLDEARRLFADHGVPFTERPLADGDVDHATAIVRESVALARPLVFVAPFTPPREPAGVADALLESWRAHRSSM